MAKKKMTRQLKIDPAGLGETNNQFSLTLAIIK